MDKLNLNQAVAFGHAAFIEADKATALYEQLVEKLYAHGADVANKIDSPVIVADALVKAAQQHVQRRDRCRLAEKALVIACRIFNSMSPVESDKLACAYKLLGHVCCRQGKHHRALKYNALAALLMSTRR